MTAAARVRRGFSPKGIALLLVATAVALPALYPVRDYLASRRSIATLKREIVETDRRIATLRAELARLKSDGEVERLARAELGMVRPGERAFVIVDPPGSRRRTSSRSR